MSDLIKNPPPGAPVPPILPPQDGFLFLDKAKFAASFAADVKPDLSAFMADSQVRWGVECAKPRFNSSRRERHLELDRGELVGCFADLAQERQTARVAMDLVEQVLRL